MFAALLLASCAPFLASAAAGASTPWPTPHGDPTRPPVPVITAMSPTSVPVGAPQLLLTIDGSGFLAGAAQVEFGTLTVPANVQSETRLDATIPGTALTQGTSRSVRVVIGGQRSNPLTFAILDPVLTSVDPVAVLAGSASASITLTGANFGPWSQIRFGTSMRAATFVDDNHLSLALTANDLQNARRYSVQVDNLPAGAGGTSSTLDFYVADPLLSALSPASVAVGSAAFTLTVTGQGFGPASQVRWDRRDLLPTTFDPLVPTVLTALVDAQYVDQLGTFEVEVVGGATGGGGTSNPLTIAVGNPSPVITGIAPAFAMVGQSNRTLVLSGSGFVDQSQARWNGSPRSTQFQNGALTVTLQNSDYAAAGNMTVEVFNGEPGGGTSPAWPFEVRNPAPTIDGTNPQTFQAGGPAATLTITGSGFNSQSVVDLDGVVLTVNSVNSTMLSTLVPASSLVTARNALLRVANPAPGGGSATLLRAIYNPVPVATALSPASVAFGSGPIQLDVSGPATGAGFNDQSQVHWNGSPLSTTWLGGNQLRAAVEAARLAAPALVEVTVFNPAPGGGTSSALTFTVANPVAQLLSLNPNQVTTGSPGAILTLGGVDFMPGCVVTLAGQALSTTRANSQQLSATVLAQQLYYGGTPEVRVVNPAPGGGASNALVLTVSNPPPTLANVVPTPLFVSSSPLTITVTGTNFVRQSVVRCNSSPLATTWINSSSMTAVVTPSFLAAAGLLSIGVTTPAPGGGTTSSMIVQVHNPVPTLASVSPMLAAAATATTITVAGSGFTSQTVLSISRDGIPLASFAPSSRTPSSLTVDIPAASFPLAFEARLAVVNPPPGGGSSSPVPFAFDDAPTAEVDDNPVTFSVSGPVHPQTDGLRWPRGIGPSTPFALRTPSVAPAAGLPTPQPGDVQDYAVAPLPSEAELFQSEPPIGGGRPAGTNNQILVADAVGLVAGVPTATARDNLNGVSFGEDWFGVTAVTQYVPAGAPTPWHLRGSLFLPNAVAADSGTSFRLSVDPYARGLLGTGVAIESLHMDDGSGTGPWLSPGNAAAEVFGTPALVLPGAPPLGTNELVHDRVALALANLFGGAMGAEDDLDALECVGDNDPASWFVMFPAMVGAGNLHARVWELPMHPFYVDGLAPPGVSIHGVGAPGVGFAAYSPPVFFTVDRRSTGKALSAVRTQWRSAEAAGDVFMAWNDSNLLLIDEQEAGLYGGAPGLPCDDMDALLLHVHPDDRYYLIELAQYHVPYSGMVMEHDPNPLVAGDEYRTGPGYSYSLLRYAWERDSRKLRMRLGFSVTTDSIGLEYTPVDYETGLDPSGNMRGIL